MWSCGKPGTVELVTYENRDEDNIKSGLKKSHPVAGMTKEELEKILGDPKTINKPGVKKEFGRQLFAEEWVYDCDYNEGYRYECFMVFFEEDIVQYVVNNEF